MNVKYHPIQKLCYVSQAGGVDFLLTAVGPHIVSLGLENGGVLSKWPDHTHKTSQTGVGDESGNRDLDDESREDDPPSKRRKLDSTEENTEEQDSGESSGSIEFASERTKGQRRKKKKIVVTPLPNVSHLICTIDGRYVIAATAEDKCIRVFEIDSGGRLKPLSERCMPKRLCAIALTRNQSIILAGDKFGDVYALPLKPSSLSDPVSQSKPKLEVPKSFKPSASELTVHTKGNREALRQQQLQKASAAKKQEPTFEHQLILGHVSLLTDLVVGIDAASPAREYILTADRDEHIRVSRGVPQAHVINNYCLGHTAFVSKLCLVPEKPQLLISAGGEPALRIYDWLQGTMLAEISLEEGLRQLFGSQPYEKRSVSCLRALYIGSNHSREDVIMIMVVMEGTPAVCVYYFYPSRCLLKEGRRYFLESNVLDVVLIKDRRIMLLSVDNVHAPSSMNRPVPRMHQPCIHAFNLKIDHRDPDWQYEWVRFYPAFEDISGIAPGSFRDIANKFSNPLWLKDMEHEIEIEEAIKPNALYSSLGEFLYGSENLRKKFQEEGEAQREDKIAGSEHAEI